MTDTRIKNDATEPDSEIPVVHHGQAHELTGHSEPNDEPLNVSKEDLDQAGIPPVFTGQAAELVQRVREALGKKRGV